MQRNRHLLSMAPSEIHQFRQNRDNWRRMSLEREGREELHEFLRSKQGEENVGGHLVESTPSTNSDGPAHINYGTPQIPRPAPLAFPENTTSIQRTIDFSQSSRVVEGSPQSGHKKIANAHMETLGSYEHLEMMMKIEDVMESFSKMTEAEKLHVVSDISDKKKFFDFLSYFFKVESGY